MKYFSKTEMRHELDKFISCPIERERMINRYFHPYIRREELPKKPQTYSERMQGASRRFADAIHMAKEGRNPRTSDKLVWSSNYQQANQIGKETRTYARQVEAAAMKFQQERKERVQAQIVHTALPCFGCGSAKGGGCKKCS